MSALQVCIRMRPLLKHETNSQWYTTNNTVQCTKKSYTFECVECERKTQVVYGRLGRPLVKKCLQGYHVSLLCYGQTTSGKTFTTLGVHDNPGILPCALRDVFTSNATISIQYIQIYNEIIEDLLSNDKTQLKIIDDDKWGTTVQAKRIPVHNFDSAIELLTQGEERRIYRETQIHEHSSRSHTIFKIYIQTQHTYSCLNIVDLAGSERLGESDINHETGYINKSLLALTTVINKLADNKQQHISYRDSKLTRLLSNSLGGNSFTLLICCISPANYTQTATTLQFAVRAKKVYNNPIENVIPIIKPITEQYTIVEQDKPTEQIQQYIAVTWGSGQGGRLGHNDDKSCKIPTQLNNIVFTSIVCGYHHTIAISSGLLYSWGRGQRGQLGHGNCQSYDIPTLIEQFSDVTRIACGWQHSMAISKGTLYTWGYGEDGQLGDGECTQRNIPTPIVDQVTDIYAGHSHSGYIKHGMLYTFGNNCDGRCMIDSLGILAKPEEVPLNDIKSVGLGVSHMGVVTKDGSVYMAGTSIDGQLGCYSADDEIATWFSQVDKFGPTNAAIQIACGDCYTVVLSSRGFVYTFGKSSYMRLGQSDTNLYEPTPLKIQPNIQYIAAGCRHAGCIAKDGSVYVWGFNFHHQLGLGADDSDQEPTKLGIKVHTLSFGYFHSAALIK